MLQKTFRGMIDGSLQVQDYWAGFKVWGVGFRVCVQGFRVQGFRVQGFRVQGFRVQGSGVKGSGPKGAGVRV